MQTGTMRWLVAPACREILFPEGELALSQWLEAGQAVVVKKGPHRVVYRVELPEVTFYIKHNLVPDARTWLRRLIRPGKAILEYQRSLAVAGRGIPTAEPLAVGDSGRFGNGQSFLITRELPETIQLDAFLTDMLPAFEPHRHQRVRKALAIALGRFIALLHNRGVLHNDLHCGNILIRLDDADWPHLYLIDLHAVNLRSALDWRRSRANLVMFNRWLSLRASRSDRLRFWRTYTECREPEVWRGRSLRHFSASKFALPRPAVVSLARELEFATIQSNLHFWRDRERRCFQVTRWHRRLNNEQVTGFAVTDLEPQLVATLLRDPDALFCRADARVLKDGRSARVVEFPVYHGGKQRWLVYKRFEVTKRLDPVQALLRPTPTVRSWLFGHSLRERALPTARPLAYLHRRRWGLAQEGYLLMEKVNATGDVRQALHEMDRQPPTERRRLRRRRIEQLAQLIRELHQRGLAHRDLKAANILQRNGADAKEATLSSRDGTSFPFCFIDLVGLSRPRHLSTEMRVKNLARLHSSFHAERRLTRTEKLRFLRVYLRWGLCGKEGWKKWWRSIAAATERKIQKNARNGRPLA